MRVKLLDGWIHRTDERFEFIRPANINDPCGYCDHAVADHGYYIASCIHRGCDCAGFLEVEYGQERLV